MQPIRVYADTSVYGGVADAEFNDPSAAFFDAVRRGSIHLVVSPVVSAELEAAPLSVRTFFADIVGYCEMVGVSTEATELRAEYMKYGVVPPSAAEDALHVAVATVSGCVVVASWNFRHLVNYRRVVAFSAVNMLQGYRAIGLHTPLELLEAADG